MMITSSDRRGEISRCKELGIAAHLIKPLKQSELFNSIAETLGMSGTDHHRAQSKTAELAKRIPPLKILLAEDSIVNQKLALALLEPHGHQITVVTNGKEAVEQRKAENYELILMDVQMPEMDGLEATRQIRKFEQENGGHIPIIAMTAHAMKGDRERCLDAGMDGYVSKPVRVRELYQMIEDTLKLESVEQTSHEKTPVVERDDNVEVEANEELQQADRSTQPEVEHAPDENKEEIITMNQHDADREDKEVLNWEQAIERSEIPAEALSELGQMFLQEAPKLLNEIRDALQQSDAQTLRRAAHTLKSSAAVFEAQYAADAALKLEIFGKEEKLDEAREALPALEQEIDRLLPAVSAHIDSTTMEGK